MNLKRKKIIQKLNSDIEIISGLKQHDIDREFLEYINEGGPIAGIVEAWVRKKLNLIYEGHPPNKVFSSTKRAIKKSEKIKLSIEILERYYEERQKNKKNTEIREFLSAEFKVGTDVIEKLWKEGQRIINYSKEKK